MDLKTWSLCFPTSVQVPYNISLDSVLGQNLTVLLLMPWRQAFTLSRAGATSPFSYMQFIS